jgi:adenine nucleotide transporter 17
VVHLTIPVEYAYFFFYSVVRGAYLRRRAAQLPKGARLPVIGTAAELLLGALAGALAQVFTIPVSVIATRQQVGRSGGRSRVAATAAAEVKPGVSFAQVASAPPTATSAVVEREKPTAPVPEPQEETDDSFLSVAREIIEEEGVTGLWLGIQPGLVLTVNPAITYGAYERIKGLLLGASSVAKLSPGKAFVVGAFSKTLATVVSSTSCTGLTTC